MKRMVTLVALLALGCSSVPQPPSPASPDTAAKGASLIRESAPRPVTPPVAQAPEDLCRFQNLELPENAVIYAAGAYSGRKLAYVIDQSNHVANQMDIAVHSPDKPVALFLGAHEPTIWNISWSEGTNIVAVYATGYYRQAIAGLEPSTPLLISTSADKGPCGYYYLSEKKLPQLNPIANRVYGRNVDLVYFVKGGRATIGTTSLPATRYLSSAANPPESYRDKSAPLAGQAGLDDALAQGVLRPAHPADLEQWADAYAAKFRTALPPVAGGSKWKPPIALYRGYVVQKPFRVPAGLHGAHSAVFIVAEGAPQPTGDLGHSTVLDINTGTCRGTACYSLND